MNVWLLESENGDPLSFKPEAITGIVSYYKEVPIEDSGHTQSVLIKGLARIVLGQLTMGVKGDVKELTKRWAEFMCAEEQLARAIIEVEASIIRRGEVKNGE